MNARAFEVGDAIRFGWATAKAHLNLVVVLTLVTLLAGGLPSAIAEGVVRGSPGLAALFRIAGTIISLIVSIGATRVSLRLHDGGTATVGDLFAVDGPLLWRYFLASLLYWVVVAVGLVLLVIPGIIFSVRYLFYGYAVVDRNAHPVEALAQSAAATKGVWGALSLFGLVIIMLNILGALALGVGLLVTLPVSALATAWVYRRLTGTTPAAEVPATV
ncbi:MAG TPA: hypothetical protein VI007_05360 [bacterium]